MGLRRLFILCVVSACSFSGTSTSSPTPDGKIATDAAPDAITVSASCGNHTIEAGEECDDGNTSPFDGCDPTCHIEPGWVCSVGSPCAQVTGLAFGSGEDLQEAGTSGPMGGGTGFTDPCPNGAALIGFDGFLTSTNTAGGQLVGALRARCAVIIFDAAGSARQTNVTETGYQGNDQTVAAGATACADGSVAVGFIANSGLYLAGLQLECVPLDFVHGALRYGTHTLLGFYGSNAGQTQQPTRCAAAEVVATYKGRSGGVIDEFDVKCGAVTAVTD